MMMEGPPPPPKRCKEKRPDVVGLPACLLLLLLLLIRMDGRRLTDERKWTRLYYSCFGGQKIQQVSFLF
jgi:hypothetical protein